MEDIRKKAVQDVLAERDRQVLLRHGGDTEEFDKGLC